MLTVTKVSRCWKYSKHLLDAFLTLSQALKLPRLDSPFSRMNHHSLHLFSRSREVLILISPEELSFLESFWNLEWGIFLEGLNFVVDVLSLEEETSFPFTDTKRS